MRFLIDQDVYAITTRFLQSRGHDVVTAADLSLSRAIDSELLNRARSDRRVFVTRDRDFGRIAFLENLGAGVIFLRMIPSTANAVHQELDRVLTSYDEEQLLRVFVVVEPARHRMRRAKQ